MYVYVCVCMCVFHLSNPSAEFLIARPLSHTGFLYLAHVLVRAGLFAPSTFQWSDAPLSTWETPVVTGAAYLFCIFFLIRCVAACGGPPAKGTRAYVAVCRAQGWHNLLLCVWSLAMLVGCLVYGAERLQRQGWEWIFCEETPATRGELYFVAYVYYISKFYELFDTFLQVLKSGRVNSPWLHLYHHSVVGIMAWLWLEQVCVWLSFA